MTRTGAGRPQGTSENSPEESWRESASRLIASGGKERLTLANRLTLARILMLPLLVLFLLQGSPTAHLVAGALFILAAFTDWLDGYLARKRGQITPLGEILDPVADKLLITAALLPLVALGEVNYWIAGIILGREFLITTLRAVALRQGLVAPAGIIGKWKMGLEVTAITALILDILPPLGTVLIWAAMLAAIISAVDYFRHILRELA